LYGPALVEWGASPPGAADALLAAVMLFGLAAPARAEEAPDERSAFAALTAATPPKLICYTRRNSTRATPPTRPPSSRRRSAPTSKRSAPRSTA
jgi:hypothetical protein